MPNAEKTDLSSFGIRHSTFLIAAGGVALAAIASSHRDLAIDEPFTALAIARPSALGATLVHDNVPLYYLLLLGWSRLFGQSAFALRSLSMAAFAGAILFSAAAARRVVAAAPRGGEGGPALTAAFVACSVTFGLQPAATARPYALVMMLAAMAVWAAVREARFPLFAAHLFGLFSHPVFIFFSLAFAAAGSAFGRRRRLLAVTPLVALGVYVVTWGARLARTAALPATSWMARPAPADVASGFLFWGDHATPILVIVILVLIAVRGPDRIRERAGAVAFLFMLTALTLTGTIGVSVLRPVYVASRTPVLVLPAVAVACGVLAAELGPRLATVALAGLVGVSAVRFTVKSAERPDPYPTRASLAAVAPRIRCGDTIVPAGLAYAAIAYYAPRAGVLSCVQIRGFPVGIAEHPGWLDLTPSGRSTLAPDARLTASSLATGSTVWVFVQTRGLGADAGAALVDALSAVRPVGGSIAVSGSFFDRLIAFPPSQSSPAGP